MGRRDKISLDSTVVVVENQVFTDLGGEVAILQLGKGIYYGLNGIGSRVWHLIQQPKRVTQVCDVLLKEYDVETERCQRDLLALLKQLSSEALIEVKDEKSS